MDAPKQLKDRPNWILWRNVDGRKVPFQTSGQPAKSNDPTTWTTYDSAIAANTNGYAGLGYVFADGEGVFGIDLDGCISTDGEIQPWASAILDQFPTYSEISPSGTGIKLWGLGDIPGGVGRQAKIDAPSVCPKAPGVEVYERGRYFTFTGRQFSDTAEVTDCQAALNALYARLWPTPTSTTPAPSGPRASVQERASRYLAKMPPAISGSGGHNQTFRAACVLVLGFGLSPDDAFPLLADWNLGCEPPWSEKELRHKLADANKKDGTRGWLLTDGLGYQGADVNLAALLAGLIGTPDAAEVEPELAVNFPRECIDEMPWMMRLAYDWILATAIKPQPELTLGALIAMFGAIFGRKVRDDYNTRTNMMILGLAPSGSGKEHPRQCVKRILHYAGLDMIVGPERIASHAGIVSSVAQHPTRLFQLDEIGRLLQTMRDPKGSPHLYNIGSVLMQLYSSSNTLWTGDAYADVAKVKKINQPCVCVYGTSVPDGFYSGLTAESLHDGLLGRMLVIESGGYGDMRKPSLADVPEELVNAVAWWRDFGVGGNLASENPDPLLVQKTPEADKRHEVYCREVHSKHNEENAEKASIWARAPEKEAKLALIYACCNAIGGPPVVTIEAVNWARRLVNYATRMVLVGAGQRVVLSNWAAQKERAWKKITDGMTTNQFSRATQWLRSRERAEVLSDWESIGAIELTQEKTNGRPRTTIKKLRSHP